MLKRICSLLTLIVLVLTECLTSMSYVLAENDAEQDFQVEENMDLNEDYSEDALETEVGREDPLEQQFEGENHKIQEEETIIEIVEEEIEHVVEVVDEELKHEIEVVEEELEHMVEIVEEEVEHVVEVVKEEVEYITTKIKYFFNKGGDSRYMKYGRDENNVGTITLKDPKTGVSITIMDKNLGAESVGLGQNSYGYYFQWGNNHGVATVNSSNKTTTKAVYEDSYYSHGYDGQGAFIVGGTDYWEDGAHYNNLWGNETKESSRYAACPAGYHIPTVKEWNQLLSIWGKIHTQDESTDTPVIRYSANYATKNIHTFKSAAALCEEGDIECVDEDKLSSIIEVLSSELKLPLAGSYDENGNFHDGLGVYWTATPKDGNKAGVFDIDAYIGEGGDETLMYKSQGHNIRCFQNVDPYEAPMDLEEQDDEEEIRDNLVDVQDDEEDLHGTEVDYIETELIDFEPYEVVLDETKDMVNVQLDANGGKFSNDDEVKAVRYGYYKEEATIDLDSLKEENYLSGYDVEKLQSVNIGYKLMDEIEIPTREGYTFDGWYTQSQGGEKIDFESLSVSEDMRVYAHWNAKEYTITWRNEDGTVRDITTVAYGEMPTHEDPVQPSDEKYTYTFAGWEPEIKVVDGDAEYRATYIYTLSKHVITWKNEDGTVIDRTEVTHGEIPTHEDPVQPSDVHYSYKFAGWEPEIRIAEGSAEYKAKYVYTVNKYTVLWKNWDGIVLEEDIDVPYGSMPSYDGINPQKQSDGVYEYEFVGWEPEISEVKGNMEYIAKFDVKEIENDNIEHFSPIIPEGQTSSEVNSLVFSQDDDNVLSGTEGNESDGSYACIAEGGSMQNPSYSVPEGQDDEQEGEEAEEEQGFWADLWETLKSFFLEDEDGYLRGSETIDDIVISVEAEEGTFPEGTEVVIKGVQQNRLESIQSSLVEDETNNITEEAQILAFDISFVYSGEEIQPTKEVSVKFNYQENSDFQGASVSELSVYHIDDETDEGTEIGVVNKDGDEIEILATEFSVFVLALTRGDPDDDGTIAITFELNGGFWYDGFGGSRVVYVESGEDIAATRPTKDPYKNNYMFMGWFDDINSNTGFYFQGTTLTGDITLTAKWAPYNDIEYCGGGTCITFMDRNMGASNVNSTGCYYQWGNNYCFKNGERLNYTGTKQNAQGYGPNNWYYGETFIYNDKGDWASSLNDNLWGGGGDVVGSDYDSQNPRYQRQGPCPKGYHVPSLNEIHELMDIFFVKYNNGSWPANSYTWPNYVGGSAKADFDITTLHTNFVQDLKIPRVGRVQGNAILAQQDRGQLWTSTPFVGAVYAVGVQIKTDKGKELFNMGGWQDIRSMAKQVRCFKNSGEYIVRWKNDDNSELEVDYYVYDGATPSYDEPENPTKEGYEFTGWYLEGDENQTVVSLSDQTITGNRTYIAKFESLAPEDAYRVTIDIEPSTGGNLQKNSRYNSGDTVTLTGMANSGFEFLGWFTGDNIISLDNPYVFTAYDSGGTGFTAVFSSLYNIYTGTNNESGGTVSYEVIDITRQGKRIRFTASPIEDFELDKWIVNGDEVSTGGSTQLDVILSGDISLTGYFVQVRNRLPCEFDGQTIIHGESVTGYQSDSVTCPNACVSQVATCNNGVWSINDFETEYSHSSCTYSGLVCDALEYPLSSCPENGICSSCTGYIVDDNACSQTNPIYKLNSCSGHYHVNGNVCEIDSYTVTIVSNNLEYGTVTQSSVTGAYGSTVTINNNTVTISGTTVTAIEVGSGSFVERLSLCGDTITGNCTIEARFRGDQYLVSFNADRGTFVSGAISQSIADGDLVTPLTEEQKPVFPGYRVVGWYKTNPRLDSNAEEWIFDQDEVTGDITLYAKWEYDLTYGDLDVYIRKNQSTTGHYTFMDRNLGATEIYDGVYCTNAASDADCRNNRNYASYGYYYQWGNTYGFPSYLEHSGALSDQTTSQQDISSYSWSNPYASSTYKGVTKEDWISSTNSNIWGGTESDLNAYRRQGPCPDGYHVPTKDERTAIKNKWVDGSIRGNDYFHKDFLMPAASYRARKNQDNGTLATAVYVNDFIHHRYLSSTASSNRAYLFKIDSNSTIGISTDKSSNAYSVRCIKNIKNEGNSAILTDIVLNGGEKAIISIAEGKIVSLQEPTKTDYVFGGWYTTDNFQPSSRKNEGSTLPGGGVTLYAKWICPIGTVEDNGTCVSGYTVSFYNEGADPQNDNPLEQVTVLSGQTAVYPNVNPTKEGYTFVGWVDGNGDPDDLSNVTVDRDVYASYDIGAENYTLNLVINTGIDMIYYKVNGASDYSSTGVTTILSGVEAGSQIYAYAVAKDGYTTDTSLSSPWSITVTGDNTFSPTATANTGIQYTVYHYVKVVGSGTYALTDTDILSGTTDELLTLSNLAKESEFLCAHYSSGSLTGTTAGPGEIVTTTTINGDGTTHIYLYYIRSYHTVTLSGDEHVDLLKINGVVTDEAVLECGSEVPVEAIPRPGYHFVRWEERVEEDKHGENNGGEGGQ